ncbi:O-6-methylguanine DNA methyltransferase [Desulfitobacterium dehalogenans ATCC 51507]|uniref:Methylated-DNA--protein-cysteine methyltransferase n=1 Tax=Desulfitobacterium dehalogenans (strain ATCC 51507 / DSM 9161 / JW/IU-DC1) TaxID=756499 RepID=I4A7W7_DESDJ|nr:methylated-DNA--[protein]-cysteine S-methyltransferase [Desulfitobacterium dehalogenans]AFM00052.1 O-6-methylguanine DNA methyltransferase [Desulfitobacterium dehalogenans ATCC 51507]
MIYTCTISTPLGPATASAEEEALTGLWFIGQKYYPAQTDAWDNEPEHRVFQTLQTWLDNYFSGRESAAVPFPELAPKGTDFQKAVWDILLEIPHGRLTTYGEIGKKLAATRGLSSMSAQAVGGAVGHNPISILIPCHRVVGASGSLTGYAGGLEKKKALLRLEEADLTSRKLFEV